MPVDESEKGKWKGWGDFLGTGAESALEKRKRQKDKIDRILKDLQTNWKFYSRWTDGLMRNWFDNEGLFDVKDPYIRSFFTNFIDLRKTVEGRKAIMYWLKTHQFSKPYGIFSLGQQGTVLNPNATQLESKRYRTSSGTRRRLLLEEDKIDAKKVIAEIRKVTDFKDPRTRELHVTFTKQLLWKASFAKETSEIKKIKAEKMNGNKFHDDVIKGFLDEYKQVKSVKLPSDFNPKLKPSLMQMYNAWKMTKVNGFFNLSRTGVGKTLAAILPSRLCESKYTLVIAPNNIVREDQYNESQWKKQILQAFKNSFVSIGKVPHTRKRDVYNYHLINYDKFSQKDITALLRGLTAHNWDFVVIDETQNVKIRDEKIISQRREAVDALLKRIRRRNPKLKVVCLTATPVINNIKEGKSLLQMITGRRMTEIGDATTVRNASRLHANFLPYSIRFMQEYNIKEIGRNSPIVCKAQIDPSIPIEDIEKMSWLSFEHIAMKAKIPEIIKRIKGKTIIYTEYVTGIVEELVDAVSKAGYSVGVYTGTDKSGKQGFIYGDTQVLIGSSAVSEGVDELQKVCSNLIFGSLPWTHARFEQVIGRIVRRKQKNKQVSVHVLLATINGYEYDQKIKFNRLEFKYQMARCVTEGTLPDKLKLPRSKLRQEIIAAMVKQRRSGILTRVQAKSLKGKEGFDV